MVGLYKLKSGDDSAMGSVNLSLASPNIRAQSSSPVKSMNRRSMPLTSHHRSASPDVLMSMLAGSRNYNNQHLRELSRSPISRKLHVSRADFAIPIPFTLQLPPKLTKSLPTTPNSSVHLSPKSPSRLIFNGNSYEAVESDCSDNETSFSRPKSIPSSPSAAKPPSVTASRKKVAHFVEKTKSIPLDQLSMIEEASTRANSVKSKVLPLVPPSPAPGGPSVSRRLLRKPPSDPEPILKAPVANRVASGGVNKELVNAGLQSKSVSPPTVESKRTDLTKSLAGGPPLASPAAVGLNSEGAGGLSHTTAFHHNLNNTSADLRIEKRTFSDESHVSSVSSFSSVGDFFSVNIYDSPRFVDMRGSHLRGAQKVKMQQPEKPGEPEISIQPETTTQSADSLHPVTPVQQIQSSRNSSTKSFVSESSEGSQSSWNSLQRSLDLTLKESLSNNSATMGAEGANIDQTIVATNEADGTTETEILPLNVTRSAEPSEKEGVDESNNGAGMGFNFPNNESNITNLPVKKKAPNTFKKSQSAYSLMSSNGQIEIPDLDDLKINQQYSQSVQANNSSNADSGSDNLEPIGMPSRAARSHFKSMYGDSTDSDSDTSFNSLFSKLNSHKSTNVHKSTKILPIKESASAPLIEPPSRISPIRHARQRSMYNIDLESLGTNVSPTRKHGRSKSSADLSRFSRDLPPIPRSPIVANLAQAGLPRATSPDSNPKIVVAEPPKKIEYAVDFKSAAKHLEKEELFHLKSPLDYYRGSNLSVSRSNNSQFQTAGTSEAASSYQSSRTAGDTMSTAPTENNSVVIDLTKDGYNLCMITRKDSQLSYKSVIEKTKDGKDVEVVLVDEDDDTNNTSDSIERDDLLSIYSHYMNDWAVRSDFKHSDLAKVDLRRSNSMLSSASEASNMTTSSWTASENNFHVKPSIASSREKEPIRLRGPKMGMSFSGQRLTGIKESHLGIRPPPKVKAPSSKLRVERPESNYFDYSMGENYDFKSFMKKQASSRAN